MDTFAVLEIDDRQIVGSCEGDELREVVRQHVDARAGLDARGSRSGVEVASSADSE